MTTTIHKGQLKKWNAAKGFGFIKPETPGKDVFVHITAFAKSGHRPKVGNTIHFQIHTDNDGRKRAVNASVEGAKAFRQNKQQATNNASSPNRIEKTKNWNLTTLFLIAIVCIAVFLGGRAFYQQTRQPKNITINSVSQTSPARSDNLQTPTNFKCEGKQHCSQMASCEEAAFYLKNCPDVKIDGDNDGVPCEREHCSQEH